MIAIKAEKDYTVIKPDFDLVSSNLDEIKSVIFDLAIRGHYQIILHLPHNVVIDPMGVGVIVACRKTLKQYGGDLTAKTDNPEIINLFKMLRLDHILE
ncbi:MAG: STAS domain-containing protein [Deltaproteobacteria bacterium]|nr:STAS domain-containing protein [Deltaproteobacteria bacterium]MBW2052283.1 STAS domain-containing protein [Deltaproteobacteria bacterium]MBW2140603.1 STAS domain-containing protein [Deltaproteobacteria bacterium]